MLLNIKSYEPGFNCEFELNLKVAIDGLSVPVLTSTLLKSEIKLGWNHPEKS